MTRGIVYFVVGRHYLKHATNSLESLRRFHPNMQATLFCNDGAKPMPFNAVTRYKSINNQYPHNELHLDRIKCLCRAPYDVNLHLDADTYVDDSLDDMFRLMDRFDLVVHHGMARRGAYLEDVPLAFPTHNSGMILWRWTPETRALLEDWRVRQEQWIIDRPKELVGHGAHACQPSWRRALYYSDVRFATVGENYLTQANHGGYMRGRAIILHGCRGHPGVLAKIAALINHNQPHGKRGHFRFHTAGGCVVHYKRGRGLLPDDTWLTRRKKILGA